MTEIEILVYFHDLAPHLQEQLLEAFGVTAPQEMNWDVFPVTEITVYPDDDLFDED